LSWCWSCSPAPSSGVLTNSSAQAIPLDKFRVLTLGMLYDNNN
jgi:hypothetical protein